MTRRRAGSPVTPGRFYGRTHDGRLLPIDTATGRNPDAWICRRLEDFPGAQAPPGAALDACTRCGAAIAYNPARVPTVPASTPRVCMQCFDIEPDPLTYTLTDHDITCHLCGRSSANPDDRRERYCGHCHVFHEDLDGVLRELSALAPMGPIGYRPETVLQLVGLIQLALRHPSVTESIRATGLRFIAAAREYFAACPAVLDVIRRGDDPREDV